MCSNEGSEAAGAAAVSTTGSSSVGAGRSRCSRNSSRRDGKCASSTIPAAQSLHHTNGLLFTACCSKWTQTNGGHASLPTPSARRQQQSGEVSSYKVEQLAAVKWCSRQQQSGVVGSSNSTFSSSKSAKLQAVGSSETARSAAEKRRGWQQ